MSASGSSNYGETRKRNNSESYLQNGTISGKKIVMDPNVCNNGCVERPPLSELPLSDSHSVYSDTRSEFNASSSNVSEAAPLLSDNEMSPYCIYSSEPKKKIKNDPPTFRRYLTIQKSAGSIVVNTWSKVLNTRPYPLPIIPWGKNSVFWQMLCNKSSATLTYRNPDYQEYLENITPRMRTILLDWLLNVSSDFKLHRETYYLAMDYLDRCLSNSESISKEKLQLTGITCLFIAAKIEEILPPKLAKFIYVTDGSCTRADLLEMEEKILMLLRFRLTPVTINYWLELMLQLICVDDSSAQNSLTISQFPQLLFTQVAHLLDFSTMDSNSLRYSYGELTTSALTIVLNKKIALTIAGLSVENISHCIEWMSVYWSVILEEYLYEEIDFENELEQVNGTHMQQQYLVSMDMYDMAQSRFKLIQLSKVKSPIIPSDLITPPWSDKRCPETVDDCKLSCRYNQ